MALIDTLSRGKITYMLGEEDYCPKIYYSVPLDLYARYMAGEKFFLILAAIRA